MRAALRKKCLIYVAAITVFSAFVLTDLNMFENGSSIGIYERIFYAWVIGQMLEDILVCFTVDFLYTYFALVPLTTSTAGQKARIYRLYRYCLDFWRSTDVLFYVSTIIAIILRFSSAPIHWARRMYSISLLLAFMRFLNFLLIFPKVGTFVIMMTEMVKDLARFFFILFVFIMAAGVMYHANMYPNHTDMWSAHGVQYWRIWKIISLPYWQIYGDLFFDTLIDKSDYECTRNQTVWESNPEIERCVENDSITLVIAAVYMLMSNLLLVNLVIAVFSVRFEKVRAVSEKLWRYNRCSLIINHSRKYPAILNVFCRIPQIKELFRCKPETVSTEKAKLKLKEQEKRFRNLQEFYSIRCA